MNKLEKKFALGQLMFGWFLLSCALTVLIATSVWSATVIIQIFSAGFISGLIIMGIVFLIEPTKQLSIEIQK